MKKNTILISLFLFLTNILFSQEVKVVRDFGAWIGFNVEKEMSKKIEVNLEQQVRYYKNATKFDDYIVDLGVKYKMNKNFKLGTNFRYSYNAKRWKDAENDYRYNLDLLYSGKIFSKFNFYYRLRYQHEYVNFFEKPSSNIHYSGIRNKLKLRYTVNKKNKLYVSCELFRLMEPFKDPYFNMLRLNLGDEIKTNIGNLNCSIGYEKEINTNYPLSFLFIETVYTIKL